MTRSLTGHVSCSSDSHPPAGTGRSFVFSGEELGVPGCVSGRAFSRTWLVPEMGQFQAEARRVQQRDGQHVHRTDAQVVQTREPLLELLEPETEGRLAVIAEILQRLRELPRHGEHVANVLLALPLCDDQVLLQRVEIALQEVGGQEVADLAEVVVEANHVDALVRLELVGLLGQERELDAVFQIGLAHAPNRRHEAIPLVGIQDAVAEEAQVLDGELVTEQRRLTLQAGNQQAGGCGGQLSPGNHRALHRFEARPLEVVLFQIPVSCRGIQTSAAGHRRVEELDSTLDHQGGVLHRRPRRNRGDSAQERPEQRFVFGIFREVVVRQVLLEGFG